MDILYYNSQIKEELDGATDYICRAIKCKENHPEHASTFAKMSEMELGHATNLIQMFEDDYKEETKDLDHVPDIYKEIRSSLLDMYTEFSTMVKMKHQTYQSL